MSHKIQRNANIERNMAIYIMNKCGIMQCEIADIYNVDASTIHRIVKQQKLKYEYHRNSRWNAGRTKNKTSITGRKYATR